MTIVSNDPAGWPAINAYRFSSYFTVASFVVVTYDWVLTFGQEIELIWRQPLSLMTVMYLGVRYLGISYAALDTLGNVTTIPLTDTECFILYVVWDWIGVAVFAMLWVIIIARLHAMYQRSRKILIFLVVTCVADNIFNVVVAALEMVHISGEEVILSGTYQCSISLENRAVLNSLTWILGTVWEILALCLAVWIAVKHFRELRRYSTGGILEDCFTVLIKTHVLYFAGFVAVTCFQLIDDFSLTADQTSLGFQICDDLLQVLDVAQMFVLGPRLILSVREYNAKLVEDSDAATGMTSIAFQERVHISTGNGV